MCSQRLISWQVPTAPLHWKSRGPRRVSVNNLGFGGANAHAILEEVPLRATVSENLSTPNGYIVKDKSASVKNSYSKLLSARYQSDNLSRRPVTSPSRLFVLSANDEVTVKQQMAALKVYLECHKTDTVHDILADLAFTLGHRRSLLSYRIALTASSTGELKKQLDAPCQSLKRASRTPNIAFVFTGQGANWQGMGRELFGAYPIFTSTIIAADKRLTDLGASWSLIRTCYLAPFRSLG